MMKNQIVSLLDEANRQKQQYKAQYEQYKAQYEHCTNKYDREMYRNAYLNALDLYTARYQMLLLFGYDVVADENNNITDIEKI